MTSETGSHVTDNIDCGVLENLKEGMLLRPNYSDPRSRDELIKEIEEFGINTEGLQLLSIEGLRNLLSGLQIVIEPYNEKRQRRQDRPKGSDGKSAMSSSLPNTDKKILYQMIMSAGHISALSLSRELDIPVSTIRGEEVG